MNALKAVARCLALLCVLLTAAGAREWYAAPDGTSGNPGTADAPLDLATALTRGDIRGGDTVWLRGGQYVGHFVSSLKGTPRNLITVRSHPGEWAVIADNRSTSNDSPALQVNGGWTVYRDFEVTNINADRTTGKPIKNFTRPMGIQVQAPATAFINLIIHDVGTGICFWSEAVDSVLYGNIIFNNGWSAPDRSWGHGIYSQNKAGTKRISENIVFNQFGWGIHIYPGPSDVQGFDVSGNIVFNNGQVTTDKRDYNNIIVEAGPPYRAARINIEKNYTFQSEPVGPNVCLSCFQDGSQEDVTLRDNYLVGGSPVISVGKWKQAEISNNTIAGREGLLTLLSNDRASRVIDSNNYVNLDGSEARPYAIDTRTLDFEGWRVRTHLDEGSKLENGRPGEPYVVVRRNEQEEGRAHIAVYNWKRQSEVEVSLDDILEKGMAFEVRNVQDFFGPPVAAGKYDGKQLRLPLQGMVAASPRGYSNMRSTGDYFAVFVVTTVQRSYPAVAQRRGGSRQTTAVATNETSTQRSTGSGQDLSRLAGTFQADGNRVRVEVQDGRLHLTALNEPERPTFVLQPQRSKFRLQGAPEGFYASFQESGGAVTGLTLERGEHGSVRMRPVGPAASDQGSYAGEYRSGGANGSRVRISSANGRMRATILNEPNTPSYDMEPAGERKWTLAGAPVEVVAELSNDGSTLTLRRGEAGDVRLSRVRESASGRVRRDRAPSQEEESSPSSGGNDLAGTYREPNGSAVVRVEQSANNLRIVLQHEKEQPTFRLRAVSENTRYRLEGAPSGFFAEFGTDDDGAPTLRIERGTHDPVLLRRTGRR